MALGASGAEAGARRGARDRHRRRRRSLPPARAWKERPHEALVRARRPAPLRGQAPHPPRVWAHHEGRARRGGQRPRALSRARAVDAPPSTRTQAARARRPARRTSETPRRAPLGGRRFGRVDREVDVRRAARVAGGAGAEAAHLTHRGETREERAQDLEILGADIDGAGAHAHESPSMRLAMRPSAGSATTSARRVALARTSAFRTSKRAWLIDPKGTRSRAACNLGAGEGRARRARGALGGTPGSLASGASIERSMPNARETRAISVAGKVRATTPDPRCTRWAARGSSRRARTRASPCGTRPLRRTCRRALRGATRGASRRARRRRPQL